MTIQHIPSFLVHRTIHICDGSTELRPYIEQLPNTFPHVGQTLYHKRNIIKKIEINGNWYVIKSFKKPNLINRIIYGLFRKSKASRSYRYSHKLLKLGINVPQPIGYLQYQICGLFNDSYFISSLSKCENTYNNLSNFPTEEKEQVLTAIGQLVAKMHDNRIYHRDLSGGNILFKFIDNKPYLEILDLNRMSFCRVSLSLGCKNFERLDASPQELVVMALAYAKARGLNPQKCINKTLTFNYHYHHS